MDLGTWLSLNCTRVKNMKSFLPSWNLLVQYSMPAVSKCSHMLKEMAGFHVQQKWACTLCMASQFLDDLPSSDAQANTDMSKLSLLSSLSSASSPSSGTSDPFSSPSCHSHETHLGHSSSPSGDFNSFKDTLPEWWDVGNRGWLSHVHLRQGVARHTPLKCWVPYD